VAARGEAVKETQHGGTNLALGAVEGRVDDLLPQLFPRALDQVQVERVEGQNTCKSGLSASQVVSSVLTVAGVVADYIDGGSRGMGR